jgi:hypothetical protein
LGSSSEEDESDEDDYCFLFLCFGLSFSESLLSSELDESYFDFFDFLVFFDFFLSPSTPLNSY